MEYKVIAKRLSKLEGLSLKAGSHPSNSSFFCIMEALSYVAGEPWGDHPKCVCRIIAAFLRPWGDSLPNDAYRDRLLKPLIPRLVGTRNKALEKKRAFMAGDWLVRVLTPAFLRLAGLTTQGDTLANLPELTSMRQSTSICGLIEAARKDAWARAGAEARLATATAVWKGVLEASRCALGNAALDAAWATVRWSSISRNPVWDIAGNAAVFAARAAAWDTARATAEKAMLHTARIAAENAAFETLRPTVTKLQISAVNLVERMIRAGERVS